MANTEKGNGKEVPTQKSVEEQLEELLQLPTTPRVDVVQSVLVQVLGTEYATIAREYWRMRVRGECNRIVGDKPGAEEAFKSAKRMVERLEALNKVAEEHDVAKQYQEVVTEWLDGEKESRQAERTAAHVATARKREVVDVRSSTQPARPED